MRRDSALLIFTRAPVPGKVKTRLIPAIGQQHAVSIYRHLLTRTLNTVNRSGFENIELWVDGDLTHPDLRKIKTRYGCRFYRQRGQDLGMRMQYALNAALRRYKSAILIGCDCATLSVDDLIRARESLLDSADVVMGPARDGGYYLIGMKQSTPELFSDIRWGQSRVASDTRAKIQDFDLQLIETGSGQDVDVPSDLKYLFLKTGHKMR